MKKLIYLVIISFTSCNLIESNNAIEASKSDTSLTKVSFKELPKKKGEYSAEQLVFLKERGLANTSTYQNNLTLVDKKIANKYWQQYQLKFLSLEYVNKFLKDKDLVMGALDNYIGSIPEESVSEFKSNYERIKDVPMFSSYYFIRYDRNGPHQGKFIAKIDESDIVSDAISSISVETVGSAGQESQWKHSFLKNKNYFIKKYKIDTAENTYPIIAKWEPLIKIIAPFNQFNHDGLTLDENNELKTVGKDPAIIIAVPEGFLVLAVWE